MDWKRIFIQDASAAFILETVIRSVIMFMILLVILKLSGKRGVRQLSVFEMAIIISLGSAVGDPMFYEDVSLLSGLLVCITVIAMYKLITWAASRFKGFEQIVEGRPLHIVEEGVMVVKSASRSDFAQDEFFAELRLRNVEHLGQVKLALLETSGEMSVFFYPDEEVRHGLPIIPKLYEASCDQIEQEGLYACHYCGHVKILGLGSHQCERCRRNKWTRAVDAKRIF